ncbi:MAG: ribosome maturation factor RimM [Fulvivirga sp.]
MDIDECYQLGHVIKKHGLNGGVTIFLDVDFPEEYSELESVFVEINKKLVPFFIESISIKGQKANIKFEEVDTVEDAERLKSLAIYLPLGSLPDLGEGQFYFHEVVGYKIVDLNSNIEGSIKSVLTGPQQDLFEVEIKGKEALIPINDQIISRVDHANKQIEIKAPEGLLEIYL